LPKQGDPRRPDPEALLAEAKREGRGKLRVFLGMAPGVGKTYEMLSSAARRKAEGVDVAVGVVEHHGRRETEVLTEDLEILPRKPVDYRGRTLMEFDIDAALRRRPGLLLVDEYAHSNAPGSRHPKRWQDVEELLNAGIDVWTTLNVQHLESLVDVVWRITGVRVRETVPDQALSEADEIELIDLTPEELRQRMAAGKVYVPETARLASERFFKAENLTALREMALRRAAQKVDDALVGHMRRQGIEGPWAAGERILVLIGAEPFGGALVRAGRRLSDLMMDAPWTVLHVERPNQPPGPTGARHTAAALKLAEQLGGSVVTVTGDNLLDTVLNYATRNNITQIVIGRQRGPRPWIARVRSLFGRSLAHVLVDQTNGAALHIVTDAVDDDSAAPPRPAPVARPTPRFPWEGYVVGAVLVGVSTGIAAIADRGLNNANLAMIFLPSVLITGAAFGLRPAIAAATLAVATYNFFFLDPRLSFRIGHAADLITFAVFFAVALTTGFLTGRVRDQARTAGRRASAVTSLLAASRRLSAVSTRDEAARALAEQAAAAAGGSAVVLLPEHGEIRLAASSPALATLDAAAMTAARWAWEKGEPAGAGTGTLPQVAWTFRPLQGLRRRAGAAGVTAGTGGGVEPADERLLLALLDQGAVALERAELAASTVESETLRRSDQLRAALLNSISHDLRTPLSTVLGSATTLIDYGETIKPAVRQDLLESIREEANRLNRYVGDLLDMTRLEGGALNPRMDWADIRDVLTAAIGRVERRAGTRRILRDFPAELSLVKIDSSLMEQAVVNILDNAVAYSPEGTDVEVAAYEDRGNVVISIEDDGKGIPTAELERVFDKFRRVTAPSDRGQGIGLGLSISKGFVEAMGGRIAAASPIHGDHGTRVLISLRKETPGIGLAGALT
jgi:two-component system sensor histidine kinase KdpD